jgi:hypothetical protein
MLLSYGFEDSGQKWMQRRVPYARIAETGEAPPQEDPKAKRLRELQEEMERLSASEEEPEETAPARSPSAQPAFKQRAARKKNRLVEADEEDL